MSTININSLELLDIDSIKSFSSHINFRFSSHLRKYYSQKFPGYYIFKVSKKIVDTVYFEGFFLSQEYRDACERKVFSPKWEKYIKSKCIGDSYILDAHDYNGEILRYFCRKDIQEDFDIEYYGNIFWIYHDIGHVYLNHIYTAGSFLHRDEMDASIFSVIKLLLLGIYDDADVRREVALATKNCLKTGKIINHEDVKYLFSYMDYFTKSLKKHEVSSL